MRDGDAAAKPCGAELVTLFDLADHGVRPQVESGCGAGRELPQQTSLVAGAKVDRHVGR